jgi:hypothetical protein
MDDTTESRPSRHLVGHSSVVDWRMNRRGRGIGGTPGRGGADSGKVRHAAGEGLTRTRR